MASRIDGAEPIDKFVRSRVAEFFADHALDIGLIGTQTGSLRFELGVGGLEPLVFRDQPRAMSREVNQIESPGGPPHAVEPEGPQQAREK